MADTAEVLRLMRHAADLLDACNPMVNAAEVDRLTGTAPAADAAAPPSNEGGAGTPLVLTWTGRRQDAMRRATAEIVALRTAATVLRMVAAAIGDGVDQEVTAE